MRRKLFFRLSIIGSFILFSFSCYTQNDLNENLPEDQFLEVFHSISSHPLYDYVAELSSDKYAGRLTGTAEYDTTAEIVAALFEKWGIQPFGDHDSYFQNFNIPYTLVFEGSEVSLNLSSGGRTIKKNYRYLDEFIPGSTSGSGEVTAEVVYVGYGTTAPELDYDDYAGVDVNGKIVLVEREAPVSTDDDEELFMKWRPYSFHQYKLENAVDHGAIGMLYHYGLAANPNNAYAEGFVYTHIGDTIIADIFSGLDKNHKNIIRKIKETLQPQSFATSQTVTIKNVTEHHPNGKGSNVIGLLKGQSSDDVIIMGAHLDHLGKCYEIMPGANDNASGVAVLLGVAEALSKMKEELKHSVMFIAFGAEEQAVLGSKIYLENPKIPLEKTACFINMDGVGCGDSLYVRAAKNYPALYQYMDNANSRYVHRVLTPDYTNNLGRPRLDASRFMWKGVPSLSIRANGSETFYHLPQDNIETITPEILEDLTQMLFAMVLDIASQEKLDFRKDLSSYEDLNE